MPGGSASVRMLMGRLRVGGRGGGWAGAWARVRWKEIEEGWVLVDVGIVLGEARGGYWWGEWDWLTGGIVERDDVVAGW